MQKIQFKRVCIVLKFIKMQFKKLQLLNDKELSQVYGGKGTIAPCTDSHTSRCAVVLKFTVKRCITVEFKCPQGSFSSSCSGTRFSVSCRNNFSGTGRA